MHACCKDWRASSWLCGRNRSKDYVLLVIASSQLSLAVYAVSSPVYLFTGYKAGGAGSLYSTRELYREVALARTEIGAVGDGFNLVGWNS